MSRNFGLRQRDMTRAAGVVLNAARERGEIGFKTAAQTRADFARFAEFAKQEGANRFEKVTREVVQKYAETLKASGLAPATQASYLSSVNSVLTRAHEHNGTKWESVTGREVGLEQRDRTRTAETVTREQSSHAIAGLSERVSAVAGLARELGLRSKEASLINAHNALREAQTRGQITISEGTKGGRERVIPVTSQNQIAALKSAASVQGKDRSMIPRDQSWAQWRNGELRLGREALQEQGIKGYHELRAAYAAERYQALTGHAAPVNGGRIADRERDLAARLQVSQELGHGRAEVLNAYIGGVS